MSYQVVPCVHFDISTGTAALEHCIGFEIRHHKKGKSTMTSTIEDKAKDLCERLSCHEILDDDADCIQQEWDNDPRWKGIERPYSPEDVLKLRGTLKVAFTFAEAGAHRLWHLLQTEDYIAALGALTGNQAVQQVEAGLKAIYLRLEALGKR